MFTIHTEQAAPDGSRELLAEIRERVGFVPNLAATIAESPAALACFSALQAHLRTTVLTPAEREVAGIVTSVANGARYAIAAHATFAARAGMPASTIAALLAGEPVDDPRQEAIRAFATALARDRGHGAETDDLTNAEQLEVVAQVAYTTFANLVANLTDTRLDDAFAAQAPDARATLGASG